MLTFNCLYYPYSKFENYKGNGENCISWLYLGRQRSVAPYNQIISSDLNLSGTDSKLQQEAVNEFFTQEEAEQLREYLAENPDFSESEFGANHIYLPVKTQMAPLSSIPRASYRYLFPIFQAPGYNLNFKVVGFYLGNYNYPLPKKYVEGSVMYKLYNDPVSV